MILPLVLILGVSIYYGYQVVTHYRKTTAPLMVLGLWALGILNIVAGASTLAMNSELGVAPLVIGLASLELGAMLYGYVMREEGPNWPLHAIRIGAEVFAVGLIVINF